MTDAFENLLAKLDKVRRAGTDRAMARCPSHEDRTPSLSVRRLDDGRILIHCHAGCGATDVLTAIGLEFDDLYPERGEYKSVVPPAVEDARAILSVAEHGSRKHDIPAIDNARKVLRAWTRFNKF